MNKLEKNTIMGISIILVIIIVIFGLYVVDKIPDFKIKEEKPCGEYSLRDYKIGKIPMSCVEEFSNVIVNI